MESALVPVISASKPEPGWALDDVALAFPLELSSSTLLMPPEEGLPRRWLKALLYLDIGAGRGDAEVGDGATLSGVDESGLLAEAAMEGGGMLLESDNEARWTPVVRGEAPSGDSTRAGDADKGGALNG